MDVISFSNKKTYYFDSLKIYSLKDYIAKTRDESDTILVCHAANLKHHYPFLKKYGNQYKKIIFYFHGHEILKINDVYPKPYPFVKTNKIKIQMQNKYDEIKIKVWQKFILKNRGQLFLFFVSNWMRNKFFHYTKIPEKFSMLSTI